MVVHPVNQRLITAHPGIGEMLPHLPDEVLRLFRREPNLCLQVADGFLNDHIRPAREVKSRMFSQSQQRIAEGRRDQDTSVQQYRKISRHSSSAPSGKTTLS